MYSKTSTRGFNYAFSIIIHNHGCSIGRVVFVHHGRGRGFRFSIRETMVGNIAGNNGRNRRFPYPAIYPVFVLVETPCGASMACGGVMLMMTAKQKKRKQKNERVITI